MREKNQVGLNIRLWSRKGLVRGDDMGARRWNKHVQMEDPKYYLQKTKNSFLNIINFFIILSFILGQHLRHACPICPMRLYGQVAACKRCMTVSAFASHISTLFLIISKKNLILAKIGISFKIQIMF